MRSHTMKRERVFTSLRRFTLHKSAPLHTTRNEAHKMVVGAQPTPPIGLLGSEPRSATLQSAPGDSVPAAPCTPDR